MLEYVYDVTEDLLPKKNVMLIREFLCKNPPKLNENNLSNNIHIACPDCQQHFVRNKCFVKHLMNIHFFTPEKCKTALTDALIKFISQSTIDIDQEELIELVTKVVSVEIYFAKQF